MSTNNKKDALIEVWQDIVEIKALVLAMSISTIFTMGAHFLAPAGNKTLQLFFGLLGAVFAFMINSFLIKPKRNVVSKVEQHDS